MDETTRFQNIPGYAPHTLKLIERLKGGKVGDSLSAEELDAVAGRDVTTDENRGTLRTAMRHVLRVHRVGWQWVRGEKRIKCANASELVNSAESRRQHVVRVSKRAAMELNVAVSRNGELPAEDRPRAMAMLAQHMTLAAMAHASTTKKLEDRRAQSCPDVKHLLEAFK